MGKYGRDNYEETKKELSKVWGRIAMSGIGALKLLNDYFEGAGYGCSRTYGFAQSAPEALFRLDNTDNIGNQHYGVTGADADT